MCSFLVGFFARICGGEACCSALPVEPECTQSTHVRYGARGPDAWAKPVVKTYLTFNRQSP